MTFKSSNPCSGLIEILHSSLAQGSSWFCKVKIENNSSVYWASEPGDDVFLSYHWFDSSWNLVVWDGRRSELPKGGIGPGESGVGILQIDPPPATGGCHLVVTLVRENHYWFDRSVEVFHPAFCTVGSDANDGRHEMRKEKNERPKMSLSAGCCVEVKEVKIQPAKSEYTSCIFTYDLFRGVEFGMHTVRFNCDRIHGLMLDSLLARGTRVNNFIPISEGGHCDVESYRRSMGLPETPQGWAKATSIEIPAELHDYFTGLLDADLVIGWGLTPAMLNHLHSRGISFLDVEIDPVRFASQLYFRVRSNDFQLISKLRTLHQKESVLHSAVAGIRSYISARNPMTLQPGLKLGAFIGQTRIDLAIVENGNLVQPVDHLEQIKKVAATVDRFLIKPHPYETDNGHLDVLFSEIPNAVFCKANVYRLLADIKMKEVVSISSSVLNEARMFGINSTPLARVDRDCSHLIPPQAQDWFRISGDAMASGCLFDSTELPIQMRDIESARLEENFQRFDLRQNLGFGWGIDSLTNTDGLLLP
jgi:hypothetical protein